jgi:hypothetical protein
MTGVTASSVRLRTIVVDKFLTFEIDQSVDFHFNFCESGY